jgi:hypothetical protein
MIVPFNFFGFLWSNQETYYVTIFCISTSSSNNEVLKLEKQNFHFHLNNMKWKLFFVVNFFV